MEAALRFLFNAMAPKQIDGFPFQGIPRMIYLDNGPVARSHVFQQVMRYLDIDVRAHLPQGKDGQRVTARSKGKVERPFRTVKEMHETLYHFHEPKDEDEANAWLLNFLSGTTECNIGPSHTHGWKIGCSTCHRPAYARCARGSVSVRSPASPSVAKWGPTH